MKKAIPIETCFQCPYHNNVGFVWIDGDPYNIPGLDAAKEWVCQYKYGGGQPRHLTNFPTIPEWCKLPDWEKI